MNYLLLQATTPVVLEDKGINIFELLIKGGPVMIPIAILSIVTVYLWIERYITIRKASKMDNSFMDNIRDQILNGNIKAAKALCEKTDKPIARMLSKGISRIGKPLKTIEDSIENVGKLEIYKLEKNINVLGIIAGIAPMFGFIGTIMGVIKIFYNVAQANTINLEVVAGGLYEKMITSAAGLMVGILAFIAYHWLNIMVDKVVQRMESNAIDFIDLLQEPTR